MFVDIKIYDEYGEEGMLAQERFLVHGLEDILWTSDLNEALWFLKDSIEQWDKQNE